jgi:quinol monooxygenase YgiN
MRKAEHCDDLSSHLNSQQFSEEFYMSENVYWVIELAVNPGRFEDLKTLVAELLEANRNKVGFLTYGVSISDDRQVCHIYERFQDSAAIINHMQSFGPKFSERFFEILKPTRFVIYGTPSAEVKDAVAPFNPVYMTRLADFRR